MEIAIEEMSERAAALDLENRQLQKALEDATRSVKVSNNSSCFSCVLHVRLLEGSSP